MGFGYEIRRRRLLNRTHTLLVIQTPPKCVHTTQNLIAIDVFKKRVIYQIRNGNTEFAIHAPSMTDPSRNNDAVGLFMASIRNMPGKTNIHFTPAVAAHNQWTILQLASKVCLETTQPEPQEPHGHKIKFETVENLVALPKKECNGKSNQPCIIQIYTNLS